MKLMLVGASGLVGQQVLRQALANPAVSRLIAPTRKPFAAAPGLENPIIDFEHLPADASWWKVDAVARTLLAAALVQAPGVHVVESERIA